MQTELEVQRTINKQELWTATMALASLSGLCRILFENMGILDGHWREKDGCIGPKRNDADLWIILWQLFMECAAKNGDLHVKHVTAHRTEKGKKAMTIGKRRKGHGRLNFLSCGQFFSPTLEGLQQNGVTCEVRATSCGLCMKKF